MVVILRRQVKRVPVGANLQVNLQHPLAQGLIGAYLPGVGWFDATRINGPLSNGNGLATVVDTPEGPASGYSGNTGSPGLITATGAVSSRLALWSTQLSFYCRWQQLGSTGTANQGLFFVQDGTNSAAGFAEVAGTGADNLYALFWGTFNATSDGAGVSNGIHGVLGSMITGGATSNVWLDGTTTYVTSTSVTGSICTLASTNLGVGGLPDVNMLAVYFWDRALKQQDAMTLEADPYGIFIQPASTSYFLTSPASLNPFVNIWLSGSR